MPSTWGCSSVHSAYHARRVGSCSGFPGTQTTCSGSDCQTWKDLSGSSLAQISPCSSPEIMSLLFLITFSTEIVTRFAAFVAFRVIFWSGQLWPRLMLGIT